MPQPKLIAAGAVLAISVSIWSGAAAASTVGDAVFGIARHRAAQTFTASESDDAYQYVNTGTPGGTGIGAILGQVGPTPFSPAAAALFGVWNPSNNAAGTGVTGLAANGFGVVGETNAPYSGVYGENDGGFAGVEGIAAGKGTGIGTIGQSNFGVGVYGATKNTLNASEAGVLGIDSTDNEGPNVGVEGTTTSGLSGVAAYATDSTVDSNRYAPSALLAKANGEANGADISSVHGDGADISSTSGYGAYITSNSADGVSAASTSGNGATINSDSGIGAEIRSNSQTGIYGASQSGIGIYAQSISGTGLSAFSTNSFGITSVSYGNVSIQTATIGADKTMPAAAFYHEQESSSNALSGEPLLVAGVSTGDSNANIHNVFSVDRAGNVRALGTFTASVAPLSAQRSGASDVRYEMYAPHEASQIAEDTGDGRLVNGIAAIRLDPAFADTIDQSIPYRVFVTPYGDSNSLYVTQRSVQGFIVREARGGHSTVDFSYRIVAQPANVAVNESRMRMVRIGQSDSERRASTFAADSQRARIAQAAQVAQHGHHPRKPNRRDVALLPVAVHLPQRPAFLPHPPAYGAR